MSINLLEVVKSHFNNDIINKAATMFGESEGGIGKAFSGIIPVILGAIVSKATTGNANDVLGMAKDAHHTGVLGGLGNFITSGDLLGKGTDFLRGLFGDKMNNVTDSIAGFAGIQKSSASSLMNLAAPATLGTVGNYVEQNNLDAGGLSSFLASQKSSIMSAMPAGLSSLAGMIGLGKIGEHVTAATTATREKVTEMHRAVNVGDRTEGGWGKWLWPLLIMALAVLAIWYFFGKGCNKKETTTTETTDTTAAIVPVDTMQNTAAMAAHESMKVKLPNGQELDAYKGGIEEKLVNFLNTDYKSLSDDSLKNTWFDFDNLTFKTGSAEITPESQHQIDNITAILKAYPAAKIKIGGYTDKTGDATSNKKLSAARATAVKDALAKAGVGSQLTGAEGYGGDFAKYPADAPESDRVKDRHVSVSVRK